MSDTEEYYARLLRRASALCAEADKAVQALMRVEDAIAEVSKSDLDVLVAPRLDEHTDLRRCMEWAMFFVRGIERVALAHQREAQDVEAGEVTDQ